MSYVAIQGGEKAIEESAKAIEWLRTSGPGNQPLQSTQIEHQLYYLHSRLLSEGGLYDPELASLAIRQALGDPLEAAYFMRAHRSTQARLGVTQQLDTRKMRLIRRISAAFKDIAGGQMLGPTPDYLQRLFRYELLDESPETFRAHTQQWLSDLPESQLPDSFPKVLDALRREGLIPPEAINDEVAFDVTREPLVFPLPRSAELAVMARAETGSLLALAYSNMRGYGDIHPTVAELRVGYLPVELPHPITGEPVEAGEVLMTECEIVAQHTIEEGSDKPYLSLGYGACFGHNECKAISMAILDRALQKGREQGVQHASEDPEFVLLHVDGIDSMGFAIHYKMPHYVTFESDVDRVRRSQESFTAKGTS